MWRFWNKLPGAGEWAIFDRSWYRHVLEDYLEGEIDEREVVQARDDVRQFEQQVADSGAVIVKFWLHISKREQKKRFKRLLDSQVTAWKVGKAERRQHRDYDRWLQLVEQMIMQTNGATRAVDDRRSHAAAFRPADGIPHARRRGARSPGETRGAAAGGSKRRSHGWLSAAACRGPGRHDPRAR